MWSLARRQQGRCVWVLLRRHSTQTRVEPEALTMRFPTMCVWGANTGVGKTLFSAGLGAACERAKVPLLYLKPVQTGFPADSDARLVAAAALAAEEYGDHAAMLLPGGQQPGRQGAAAGGRTEWWLTARTLYAWSQPVSPHVAVAQEGRPVSDAEILGATASQINAFAAHMWPPGRMVSRPIKGALSLVETAGGPGSPGPSGTLQCDLLRPLRLPGILVGDGALGGISATLSALEMLWLRGCEVPFVLLMDRGLGNAEAIQKHVGGRAEVVAFPVCPPPPAAASAPGQQGVLDESLRGWLEECVPLFDGVLDRVLARHQERQEQLKVMAQQARQVLWWPFTQHGALPAPAGAGAGDEAVTVIDARAGERFAVWRPQQGAAGGWRGSEMQLQYDACASWWTQGVNQEAQPRMARAVGHAAGRYGHVMYPENVHEPALELARRLVSGPGVGAGWASRVFYSDNGSTAIEVALKMAFRRFMTDQGILEDEGTQLQVVGLAEGYHGDTLGAMDAVSPTAYNGRGQTPWYSPRGLFLDAPTVALVGGEWAVRLPAALAGQQEAQRAQQAQQEAQELVPLPSLQAAFDPARGGAGGSAAELAERYRRYIRGALAAHAERHPAARLGACILEPVLQGAGGMRLIDPLFQRELVRICREEHGMPIIFDEVFTGLWRLGAPSGAALLGAAPDIACYAKLLTGGMIPLAATLASEAVFEAFRGNAKTHALLHGHSYTAHPLGCSAAVEALQLYEDPSLNPNLCLPPPSAALAAAPVPAQGSVAGAADGDTKEGQHRCTADGGSSCACQAPCGRLRPLWDEARARALSRHPRVQAVVAIGTVLAVELKSATGGGYGSDEARAVTARLRQAGVYSRPLGNVVYLMVTPMTAPAQCSALLGALEEALAQQG